MALSTEQILRHNIVAFDHMLRSLGKTYADFVLSGNDRQFQSRLDYIKSDDYIPHSVLDGIGESYEEGEARKILLSTALDVPMSSFIGVPEKDRDSFLHQARQRMKSEFPNERWYTKECFGLRMRPLIEGSRKSREGYMLEMAVRESLERICHRVGMTVDPRIADKGAKDRTVIRVRKGKNTVCVQVKGVNSQRHHAERAKILARFAYECQERKEIAMPILVGFSQDIYHDMPELNYIRMYPMRVIEMEQRQIDRVISKMLSAVI